MDPTTLALISVGLVFVLIMLGIHIGVALATISVLTIWFITGKFSVAISLLQTTAYSAVMDYVFAVVPLFVLMGLFSTLSGATRELFTSAQVFLGRVRGGIGIATVFANAVFAAITGVSIASAAVFSKIALPEMERLQYDRKFSLGIVAGSAILGIAHHTPYPRQAFMNLVKCLKAEGIISVWLYGTAGRFTDFKTNPWKKGRRRYLQSNIAQRAHWLMVLLRENIYHALRALTTRIHLPLLYLLCYPLAVLGKVPLIKYLTASVHRNWRVRLQENFDWFSPQYQSHHSKEEVRGWFDAARVEVISQLEHGFIPKVGFKGRVRKRHEANTQGWLPLRQRSQGPGRDSPGKPARAWRVGGWSLNRTPEPGLAALSAEAGNEGRR